MELGQRKVHEFQQTHRIGCKDAQYFTNNQQVWMRRSTVKIPKLLIANWNMKVLVHGE